MLSQSVIKHALFDSRNADILIQPDGRIFKQRDYITSALNDIPGITAVKPDAAFYIFPKIQMQQFDFVDDQDFVLKFLREKHVRLTQGTGFNWKASDHFHLVYLPNVMELKRIIKDMGDFMSCHRRKMLTG